MGEISGLMIDEDDFFTDLEIDPKCFRKELHYLLFFKSTIVSTPNHLVYLCPADKIKELRICHEINGDNAKNIKHDEQENECNVSDREEKIVSDLKQITPDSKEIRVSGDMPEMEKKKYKSNNTGTCCERK